MKQYNTDINIIGSIPDYNLVFKSFELYSQNDFSRIREIIIINNEFNIRTERSRKLFSKVLETSVLVFQNSEHENFLKSIFKYDGIVRTKEIFLFLQFAINNALFYDITKNVFLKLYNNNRFSLPKNEIVAYIKELFKELNYDYLNWSEATIDIVASKYLTFLKKLNFLEGKNKKKLNVIHFNNTTFILFIYFLKICFPDTPNILNNPLIDFCFQSKDVFCERVKTFALKDYFNMSFTGNDLKIDTIYNYNDILNVILNRQSKEIQ